MTFKSALVVLAAVSTATASATLLFDSGPANGTFSGAWQNQTALQNFAGSFSLASNATVTTYDYFTSFDPSTFGTMHVKLLADAGGVPGGFLAQEDDTIASYNVDGVYNGNTVYKVVLNLTTPWNLTGGTTYWAGASGNGFEAAAINWYDANGGGTCAQFSGTTYSFMASIGNQDFQLEGQAVPEPSAFIGLAGLSLGFLKLRRKK